MDPVKSSNISEVGYDHDAMTLDVKFKNGTHYRYARVPPEVLSALCAAESPGSYFHQHIRQKYEGVKLTGEP